MGNRIKSEFEILWKKKLKLVSIIQKITKKRAYVFVVCFHPLAPLHATLLYYPFIIITFPIYFQLLLLFYNLFKRETKKKKKNFYKRS